MTEADTPLPVVVVGAGPVGMAVALGLAQRGIAVTVLEAATQVSFGSRAICVSRHSLEVADRLGFGEELSRLALPWVGGRSFYRDVEVLRFLMPNEPHAVRGPMVNVSQSEFEQMMADALAMHPLVTLHWGAAVTGCTTTGDGVDPRGRHRRGRPAPARPLGRGRRRRAQPDARADRRHAAGQPATRGGTSSPTSTGSRTCPPSGRSGSTRRATPAPR